MTPEGPSVTSVPPPDEGPPNRSRCGMVSVVVCGATIVIRATTPSGVTGNRGPGPVSEIVTCTGP